MTWRRLRLVPLDLAVPAVLAVLGSAPYVVAWWRRPR
jgi:hypothetical protein